MKTVYLCVYLVIQQTASSNYYHDAFFDREDAKNEAKRLQDVFTDSFMFVEEINIKCKEEEIYSQIALYL